MKTNTYSIFIALIAMLSMAGFAEVNAQTDSKLRNDPTYSLNNYKHPNKAVAAQAWNPAASLTVSGENSVRLRAGDYKRFANRDSLSTTLAIPRVGAPGVENYKTPRPRSSASWDRLPAEPNRKRSAPEQKPMPPGISPIQE